LVTGAIKGPSSHHNTPHLTTSLRITPHRITSRRAASNLVLQIASHRIEMYHPPHIAPRHFTSHRIATQRNASHRIAPHRIASHRLAAHRIIQITTHTRMIHITSRIRITDIARCAQKIFWHIGFAPRAENVCGAFLANKKIL